MMRSVTKPEQPRHSLFAVIVLASLVAIGCSRKVAQPTDQQPSIASEASQSFRPQDAETGSIADSNLLARANEALREGRFDEVLSFSRRALLAQPGDVQWVFLTARAQASMGDLRAAIESLSSIPNDHPEAGLPALGMSADWLRELGENDQAIERYERILEIDPTITMAHRQLAELLNRLGHRQSAIDHVRVLCKHGDVLQQELASLICCKNLSTSNPTGRIAKARQLLAQDDFDGALNLLVPGGIDEALSLDNEGLALLGRIATESQDRSATVAWWNRLDERQTTFAEHWYALGLLASRHLDQPNITADLLMEAVDRDPTDWVAYGLLENSMNRLDNKAAETEFNRQTIRIKRSILASNRIAGIESPQSQDVEPLAQLLDELQRPMEANLWRYIAAANSVPPSASSQETLGKLQQRHRELVQSAESFASGQSISRSYPRHADPLLLWRDAIIALESALPWLAAEPTSQSIASREHEFSDGPELPLRMMDIAANVGLQFQYDNASPRKERDFLIYEQFGGGVAVLDYDLDGRADLYFGQAAGVPLESMGAKPNCLYRQVDASFSLVTAEAQADDRGYTLGVSAGDLNQDGFDDVIVCNFGINSRLINQGDGTFKLATFSEAWQHEVWTSSVAIGDVNHDGLPDVIEVNYLDDPEVFDVPPLNQQGRQIPNRGPESFHPASDRVLLQQADGQWTSTSLSPSDGDASPGLGVVLANVDRINGLEFFVANDTRPNHLWQTDTASTQGQPGWRDAAKLLGCAYSAQGGSGASMGIAAADFDHNGELDFHVTNFYNEPVHFYLQDQQHSLTDAVIPSGMYGDSMPVLGFGTSALDFENDGDIDIVVLNGHVEDLRFKDAPFKMLAQVFRQQDSKFTLVPPQSLMETAQGNYFVEPSLGRGLVRLDWNRDGRIDLVATHLDQLVALLENQTKSDQRWLQIELVGTACERRAVGAVVTVETDRGSWTEWVTSGDGYSCRNEPCLFFGLGSSTQVRQITVQWPDGSAETTGAVSLDQRVQLAQFQPIWKPTVAGESHPQSP